MKLTGKEIIHVTAVGPTGQPAATETPITVDHLVEHVGNLLGDAVSRVVDFKTAELRERIEAAEAKIDSLTDQSVETEPVRASAGPPSSPGSAEEQF